MRLLTLIIKTKITEGNSVICDGEKRALGARARDIVSSIGFGERKRGRVGFRHYARSNESTSGLCKRGSSSKLYRPIVLVCDVLNSYIDSETKGRMAIYATAQLRKTSEIIFIAV
ncbi:uncharacterized protein LOC133821032 isoform X2 [Humulus lupulus]|uniref:uncharacterized protein LOC133821032 isoform X2 n=1 Tax=Humulus lupulus TaxID=3486 RepID=UPI002B413C14|nr:uncharacterized protein LOC133821032 isoform X2 [Humulus lupulus]